MSTIKEHDLVRLKKLGQKTDLTCGPVKIGDVGTVVHIYRHTNGKTLGVCEVEFPALKGNTMTLLTFMIEPI